MMIDFTAYVDALKKRHGISGNDYTLSLSQLLASNGWLDALTADNGRLYATDDFISAHKDQLEYHAKYYHLAPEGKNRLLIEKLREFAPKTADKVTRYRKVRKLDDDAAYILLDFLCKYLPGELEESTEAEIETLMSDGYDTLAKVYGDILADYVNWTRDNYKTIYYNHYYMPAYSDKTNDAYTEGKFLLLIFYLFNPGYIADNDMYAKAARSKNYVDTWLYLSLHCICALRDTDLFRLPHPRLPIPAADVLQQIADGSFSDTDAKATLYSILYTLSVTKNVPHKTQSTSGVADIKFCIPGSCEIHMGTLFAAAEAHYQILRLQEIPLIRAIRDWKRIRKYMGDDIADIFLEADFCARSANKAFLQMIYIMTDQVNDDNDDYHVKGYILAALARSHKGSYGEYAKTTSIYLKDAKMSGMTPEFVARELMERGVLSCIPDMLLKMLDGENYRQMSVHDQTQAIQVLSLTPLEAEKVVATVQRAKSQALTIANEIYADHSRKQILDILHHLGNGDAQSKQDDCLCLLMAMEKPCKYPNRYHMCIGCEYEISTKATMLTLTTEYRRLLEAYNNAGDDRQKQKYRTLAAEVVVPAISSMLDVIRDRHGNDAADELLAIVKKVM